MPHVHFIGIGGSGLSAIARLLLESGYTVSGSDLAMTPFADEVRKAGAQVFVGHHPRNITGADWVVHSSAITEDNPEVEAAKRAGIPVYKRADFLGRLMEDKKGIAIAGTNLQWVSSCTFKGSMKKTRRASVVLKCPIGKSHPFQRNS